MRIRFFGQRNILGGGFFFSEFSRAARELAVVGSWIEEIDPDSPEQLSKAIQSSKADDLNNWFWAHHGIAKVRGLNVVWAIFESTRLPEPYLDFLLRNSTLLWVPSAWGRDVLLAHGVSADRVDVVPEGVCSRNFHPFLREPRPVCPSPFKFMVIGKFEERKGLRQLLEGFGQVFSAASDVELYIKADYFLDHERKRAELEAVVKASGLQNIRLVFGALSNVDMLALYCLADAFVFPSRAEGWGLPLIEALACGVPAITTFHSGHTEYLSSVREEVMVIDHALEPISDPDFVRWWPSRDADHGLWARPEPATIARCMREMIENYPLMSGRALRASEVIRERFDWSRSAAKAFQSLADHGLMRTHIKFG
ncbi:MAG: glycosyltransferase family 4 protein [Gammaproteobacteria bacterium]|nr:glycosyltransferase family 4 protein [Gammaproteobacteria bacterium]